MLVDGMDVAEDANGLATGDSGYVHHMACLCMCECICMYVCMYDMCMHVYVSVSSLFGRPIHTP